MPAMQDNRFVYKQYQDWKRAYAYETWLNKNYNQGLQVYNNKLRYKSDKASFKCHNNSGLPKDNRFKTCRRHSTIRNHDYHTFNEANYSLQSGKNRPCFPRDKNRQSLHSERTGSSSHFDKDKKNRRSREPSNFLTHCKDQESPESRMGYDSIPTVVYMNAHHDLHPGKSNVYKDPRNARDFSNKNVRQNPGLLEYSPYALPKMHILQRPILPRPILPKPLLPTPSVNSQINSSPLFVPAFASFYVPFNSNCSQQKRPHLDCTLNNQLNDQGYGPPDAKKQKLSSRTVNPNYPQTSAGSSENQNNLNPLNIDFANDHLKRVPCYTDFSQVDTNITCETACNTDSPNFHTLVEHVDKMLVQEDTSIDDHFKAPNFHTLEENVDKMLVQEDTSVDDHFCETKEFIDTDISQEKASNFTFVGMEVIKDSKVACATEMDTQPVNNCVEDSFLLNQRFLKDSLSSVVQTVKVKDEIITEVDEVKVLFDGVSLKDQTNGLSSKLIKQEDSLSCVQQPVSELSDTSSVNKNSEICKDLEDQMLLEVSEKEKSDKLQKLQSLNIKEEVIDIKTEENIRNPKLTMSAEPVREIEIVFDKSINQEEESYSGKYSSTRRPKMQNSSGDSVMLEDSKKSKQHHSSNIKKEVGKDSSKSPFNAEVIDLGPNPKLTMPAEPVREIEIVFDKSIKQEDSYSGKYSSTRGPKMAGVTDRCPKGHFLNPLLSSFNLKTGLVTVPCRLCKRLIFMKSRVNKL